MLHLIVEQSKTQKEETFRKPHDRKHKLRGKTSDCKTIDRTKTKKVYWDLSLMELINFLNGISNKKSTWSGLLYLMKTCKYQCFNKYILREEKNIQTIQTLYYASNFALKENAAQIIAQWLQNIYIVPLNVNVNVSLLPFFKVLCASFHWTICSWIWKSLR